MGDDMTQIRQSCYAECKMKEMNIRFGFTFVSTEAALNLLSSNLEKTQLIYR